jgi:hypothetical protein
MTDTSLEQPTAETWTRVGLLSSVSVMIGLANQAIVSSLLARYTLAAIVGYGTGGIISSAIQGAYWRRFISGRFTWMVVSAIAWMVIAVPVLWFAGDSFHYWLCDHVMRRALVGGVSGAIVGGIQALVFRHRSRVAWGWIVMSMVVWAILYRGCINKILQSATMNAQSGYLLS